MTSWDVLITITQFLFRVVASAYFHGSEELFDRINCILSPTYISAEISHIR